LPSLLDLAGVNPQEQPEFDGISLAPVFQGNALVPEDRMVVINYSRMPYGFNYPSPSNQSILRREDAAVLWKRWRLLENRELYDLISDPMQKSNVIDQFPEVTEKMRNHLYSWWDGVSEKANEPQAVTIGSNYENPMLLTAVEWLDVFQDLQRQVRLGDRKNGYWHLYVDHPGEYEFELRRWPREINLPLSAPLPENQVRGGDQWLIPGVALPITAARILITENSDSKNGKTVLVNNHMSADPQDTFVRFTAHLEKGPIMLHTWFDDAQNQPIVGAYYVYVNRK
jgi:hypothetical protein